MRCKICKRDDDVIVSINANGKTAEYCMECLLSMSALAITADLRYEGLLAFTANKQEGGDK